MTDSIQLTPREKEVLALLALGHNNKQIGQKLNIAVRTVENHLRAIYTKLDVRSRTQAAVHPLAAQCVQEMSNFRHRTWDEDAL